MEARADALAAAAELVLALEQAARSDAVAARRSARVERRLLRGGEPVILDALHLASRVPVAFLFMPLAGGESHTPEEHATAEDVELAGAVLVDLMAASVLSSSISIVAARGIGCPRRSPPAPLGVRKSGHGASVTPPGT
jgi:hypothetical protein